MTRGFPTAFGVESEPWRAKALGTIDHRWLMTFVEHRIADRRAKGHTGFRSRIEVWPPSAAQAGTALKSKLPLVAVF
jgi:hypothetical protein